MDRSGDGEQVIMEKVFNCSTVPTRELSFGFSLKNYSQVTLLGSSNISSVGICLRCPDFINNWY